MTTNPDLSDLGLAETVVVRLCHDLAGQVSVLGNGFDLMAAEGGAIPGTEALDLMRQSAAALAVRLTMVRAAFGKATSRTLSAEGGEIARRYAEITGGRTRPVRLAAFPEGGDRPADWWRLALLLVMLGTNFLPRGGEIRVAAQEGGLVLGARGEPVTIPGGLRAALTEGGKVSPETVPVHWLRHYARVLGLEIRINENSQERMIALTPPAGEITFPRH